MATNLTHYFYCLIMLSIFIAEGDGRWKKKDKVNLQHDIEAFKVIADKIEREIELLYEDHADDNNDKGYDTIKNYALNQKNNTQYKSISNNNEKMHNVSQKNIKSINYSIEKNTSSKQSVSFVNKVMNQVTKKRSSDDNWPKFEDILLEMGKRYDWKNDRWIKVKRKGSRKALKVVKSDVNVHEKHNFKYRTVKLNRNKSRRNIVIAVTAVR